MTSARLLFVLGLGIASSQPALAQETTAWIGAPNCRLAAVKPTPAQPPAWSGGCKDGYADGKGVLEWRDKKGRTYRLEATFAAGQVQGEGELHYTDGIEYTGTLKDGVPEGHGYMHYPDGTQYQGGMHKAHSEGLGEALYASGNDYKGQWKDDLRDGTGTMTYMLGGRYEGGWKNDKPSGPGKLVYAGPPGRELATIDGVDPNRPATPSQAGIYGLRLGSPDSAALVGWDRDLGRGGSPVPPDLGYAQLSAEQQAIVKSWYPALAPGDEPPYPLHGPGEFYRLMAKVIGKTGVVGTVRVFVTVGKDGKAASVRAVGLDSPESRKLVASVAGALDYKPALCAGQPCEMAYPFIVALQVAR